MDDIAQGLFNSVNLLRIAQEIAGEMGDGVFYARMIASRTGIGDPQVGKALKRLEKAGVIVSVPSLETLRKSFERVDDPFWTYVRSVRTETTAVRANQ